MRVEVIDVVNVIFDGIDVVMFFEEMVVGKYLVEIVKMMVRIVKIIEVYRDFKWVERIVEWKMSELRGIWLIKGIIKDVIMRSIIEVLNFIDIKYILILIRMG